MVYYGSYGFFLPPIIKKVGSTGVDLKALCCEILFSNFNFNSSSAVAASAVTAAAVANSFYFFNFYSFNSSGVGSFFSSLVAAAGEERYAEGNSEHEN